MDQFERVRSVVRELGVFRTLVLSTGDLSNGHYIMMSGAAARRWAAARAFAIEYLKASGAVDDLGNIIERPKYCTLEPWHDAMIVLTKLWPWVDTALPTSVPACLLDKAETIANALRSPAKYTLFVSDESTTLTLSPEDDTATQHNPKTDNKDMVIKDIENNPRNITGVGWKHVLWQLLEKRGRDEPYTSMRKLAEELGCSDQTIRKAIQSSRALQAWRAQSKKTKSPPKTFDLKDLLTVNAPKTTEATPDDLVPDDLVSDDKVNAIMAQLIDGAMPDERAELNALDDDGRRRMAVLYLEQCRDVEQAP